MPRAKKPTEPTASVTVQFPLQRTDQPEDKRLQALALHGANDLREALLANEDQILKDMKRLKQEEGDGGKFKIALALTMDLEGTTIDTSVSYSVKNVTKATHELSAHPELGLEDN